MTDSFDPQKEINEEIIKDLDDYLKLPLTERTKDWIKHECEHYRVELDSESKTVTCQDCKKVLDAFWYLQLLAKEWEFRRYRDYEAIKAYRALKQQQDNAKARGLYAIRPDKGDGANCWDTFELLHGHQPDYVYYRGGWYAGYSSGEESFDLLKIQVANKNNAYKTDSELFINEVVKNHNIYKYLAEMIYNEGFKNGRKFKSENKESNK